MFLIRCLISDVSVEIVQGDKPSIACNYEHNLYGREHYRELERSKFPPPEGENLHYKMQFTVDSIGSILYYIRNVSCISNIQAKEFY